MLKYDFYSGWYSPSNGTIANVVLCDLDLHFQGKTFSYYAFALKKLQRQWMTPADLTRLVWPVMKSLFVGSDLVCSAHQQRNGSAIWNVCRLWWAAEATFNVVLVLRFHSFFASIWATVTIDFKREVITFNRHVSECFAKCCCLQISCLHVILATFLIPCWYLFSCPCIYIQAFIFVVSWTKIPISGDSIIFS